MDLYQATPQARYGRRRHGPSATPRRGRATNLLEDIDDAVLRSGRFDERIEVPPPDAEARREILRVHLADRPRTEDIAWDVVTARTEGFAASDLALVADNAARRAMQAAEPVGERHLVEAAAATDSSIADWGANRVERR